MRVARRVVSLVPSETESVVALAGVERLVGRTEWCEEPAGTIERVPTVGGTKSFDVRAVIALEPDLVLANREENGRRDVEALIEAGLDVHLSFPCTAHESDAYLETLARRLGVAAPQPSAIEAPGGSPLRCFVPIWKAPWMTFDERTYGSDVLRLAGFENVFAGRARRFPLAADVGDAPSIDAGERDTRYPRTSEAEIRARAPQVVLLPDEPYRFTTEDAAAVEAWGLEAKVRQVSGKDLFWYGVRAHSAIARLRAIAESLR